MELHMDRASGYNLDYTDQDGPEVDAELAAMLDDKRLKHDAGRLLHVLTDIARRGTDAEAENIHLQSTTPALHAVSAGTCTAYYAYGAPDGRTTVFLLGFYEKGLACSVSAPPRRGYRDATGSNDNRNVPSGSRTPPLLDQAAVGRSRRPARL
jgi:hypothetical protein